MHTFFGCNFPIFLFGCGGVAHLRDIGFDVFDDIVDHSYDSIENPFDRIITAIDSNKHLLTNGALVKDQWRACQSRFASNINVAKTITTYYQQRAQQIWNKLHWVE